MENQKKKQLKSGVILSYGNILISNVISIVYTPVMLRLLGKSEYGLYQLAASVVSYLALFNLGFGSAYVRFYSERKVKNDEEGIAVLNGMFLSIFLVLGLLAMTAGFVLTGNTERIFSESLTSGELETAKVLMLLLVINLALTFPISVFDCYIMAHEQYFFQRMLSLVQTVLNPFIALPLLLIGYRSVALVAVTTILTVMKLVMNLWFCLCRNHMKFQFHGFKLRKIKEIWIFSFYIFMNMVVDQINWGVDKFLLGKMMGTASVAVYAVAAQINTYFMSFSTSVSSVFIPRVNRLAASGRGEHEMTKLFTKVGRIQFFILSLILSGFVLFGRYFIRVWAGEEYRDTYFIALILLIPVLIPLIQNIGIEIQRAKNQHKFRSVVYLLIAVSNIFISIPLIHLWGEIGAAAGTAISLTVGNILVMNFYYHLRVGLDMIYFWKQMASVLPGLVTAMAAGGVFVILIGDNMTLVWFIAGILAYMVVYFAVMWFMGLNRSEKDLIRGILPASFKTK